MTVEQLRENLEKQMSSKASATPSVAGDNDATKKVPTKNINFTVPVLRKTTNVDIENWKSQCTDYQSLFDQTNTPESHIVYSIKSGCLEKDVKEKKLALLSKNMEMWTKVKTVKELLDKVEG